MSAHPVMTEALNSALGLLNRPTLEQVRTITSAYQQATRSAARFTIQVEKTGNWRETPWEATLLEGGIPDEIPVSFGDTENAAKIQMLYHLYDHKPTIFAVVATDEQKAIMAGNDEICEGCLAAPVHLSVDCKACCAERGIKADPPDAD